MPMALTVALSLLSITLRAGDWIMVGLGWYNDLTDSVSSPSSDEVLPQRKGAMTRR